MLSLSQKERLLNWDLLVTPEETLNATGNTHQHKEQVEFMRIQAAISAVLEKNKPAHEMFFSPLSLDTPAFYGIMQWSKDGDVSEIRGVNSTLC